LLVGRGRGPRTTAGAHPSALQVGAVTRRCLRYWAADPRYLSAMLASVALPLVIVLLLGAVVEAPAAVVLSIAPLMGGTIGWGRHNDVAYDGSAFWMHVVARPAGWTDRAGRAAAVLAWAVPLVVLVGVLAGVTSGRPDLGVAAVGAGVGVLLTGLAVSAVSSASLVYPVPQAGGNPFAAPAGSLGAGLVAQLVTSLVTLVLASPVLLVYAAALWWDPVMAWVALGLGVLGGGALLAVGVVLGGRVLDRRAPRLAARLV
ncbi:hypothetical protein N869_07885, partial [Cellulomonas bogoriensis 69B4 = DSM 16987]